MYEADNQIIPFISKCFPDGTAYMVVYYAASVGCTSKPLAYYKSSTGKIRTESRCNLLCEEEFQQGKRQICEKKPSFGKTLFTVLNTLRFLLV